MNRIDQLFQSKRNVLSIYVTAGFPEVNDTMRIVTHLASAGVDLIEIGMPFSDPLADGETIQHSSRIALKNGITVARILDQVKIIRQTISIPIVLMGYYNQVLRYGDERFFRDAKDAGADGVILPDLPVAVFQEKYMALLLDLDLKMPFLITPQTTTERIRLIDSVSTGFLYVVAQYSTTGGDNWEINKQTAYFEQVRDMHLKNPTMVGFGISSKDKFLAACSYANGGIIGSAFIRAIENSSNLEQTINQFIQKFKQ